MGDTIGTTTNRKLPPMSQMHLWAATFHIVELFKNLIPEGDNHIVMALTASTMTEVLSKLDEGYDWMAWATDIIDDKK